MIKTKSVYDKQERGDGIRILITRFHPRIKGFKKGIAYKHWLRNFSPKLNLLMSWKAKALTEEEFRVRYEDLLYDLYFYKDDEWVLLTELAKSGKTITLLCYEKEGEVCHRHILKKYLDLIIEQDRKETK